MRYRFTLVILIGFSFLSAAAQAPKSHENKTAGVALGFEQGAYGPATRDEIAAAWAGQLAPMLRTRFLRAQDPAQKASIAAALVELGDKDDTYWNFLVEYAQPALESDAPDWSSVDGRGGPDGQSEEYRSWARAHHIEPGSSAEVELEALPNRIGTLGSTLDPRAVPYLRQALQRPNLEVVAASGLDALHDTASIPLIIEACKRVPLATAKQMAAYLDGFDDPAAKAAVKLYRDKLPNPVAALTGDDPAAVPSSLEQIADSHRVEAIPELEKRFQEAPDTYDPTNQDSVLAYAEKPHIASVLVRLGDSNPAYWDYLAGTATLSLESSAPAIMAFDAEGKSLPDPSPQFLAWARAHGKKVEDAAAEAMFVDPDGIMFLGTTKDPRALPLLRRALQSSNFMIQGAAARFLADQQDSESIPLLIAACRTAPHEIASGLAGQLARFDDPKARAAAAEYMPQALVNTLYEDAHAHAVAGQKPN